jgi:hypothetical protein
MYNFESTPPPSEAQFWERSKAESARLGQEYNHPAANWSPEFGWQFIDPAGRKVNPEFLLKIEALGKRTQPWLPQDGIRDPLTVLLDAVREHDRNNRVLRHSLRTAIRVAHRNQDASSKKEIAKYLKEVENYRHLGAAPKSIKFTRKGSKYSAEIWTIQLDDICQAIERYCLHRLSLAEASERQKATETSSPVISPESATTAAAGELRERLSSVESAARAAIPARSTSAIEAGRAQFIRAITGRGSASATGAGLRGEALEPDNDLAKLKQFAIVDAFRNKVLAETGTRITRKNIYTVAGYKNRSEFQKFQRDESSPSVRRKFGEILTLKPEEFLNRLKAFEAKNANK